MTGLEKIIKKIEDESNASAFAAIEAAKLEAEDILLTAAQQASQQRAAITAQSEAETADVLALGQSAAALAKRRAMLSEKQQIISDMIAHAQASLLLLPEKEYFELITTMAEKFMLPQSGEVYFSAADLERLPTGFGIKLGVIAITKGGTLKVAKTARPINGGFVLVYHDGSADGTLTAGDIEINCSFEALFYSARESLQDTVSELLFS